jgi:hypothetical protein
VLEIALGGRDIPLVGVVSFSSPPSSLATTAMHRGCHFYPFLPPLAPFLMPLAMALNGATQPPLAAAFVLPRMKAVPTASSLEACQVAVSSISLVVFSYSRPSLCTKVRHVVPSQNTEKTLASATLGKLVALS